MCLAVPARVTEINGKKATVDMVGVVQQASIMMMPDVQGRLRDRSRRLRNRETGRG